MGGQAQTFTDRIIQCKIPRPGDAHSGNFLFARITWRNSSNQMLHFRLPNAGRDGLPGFVAALQNAKNP